MDKIEDLDEYPNLDFITIFGRQFGRSILTLPRMLVKTLNPAAGQPFLKSDSEILAYSQSSGYIAICFVAIENYYDGFIQRTHHSLNGIRSLQSFEITPQSEELIFGFGQEVAPNFICLHDDGSRHDSYGQGDEKPYTVENGTFDVESAIDEAYVDPISGLYNGYYWDATHAEVEQYRDWQN